MASQLPFAFANSQQSSPGPLRPSGSLLGNGTTTQSSTPSRDGRAASQGSYSTPMRGSGTVVQEGRTPLQGCRAAHRTGTPSPSSSSTPLRGSTVPLQGVGTHVHGGAWQSTQSAARVRPVVPSRPGAVSAAYHLQKSLSTKAFSVGAPAGYPQTSALTASPCSLASSCSSPRVVAPLQYACGLKKSQHDDRTSSWPALPLAAQASMSPRRSSPPLPAAAPATPLLVSPGHSSPPAPAASPGVQATSRGVSPPIAVASQVMSIQGENSPAIPGSCVLASPRQITQHDSTASAVAVATVLSTSVARSPHAPATHGMCKGASEISVPVHHAGVLVSGSPRVDSKSSQPPLTVDSRLLTTPRRVSGTQVQGVVDQQSSQTTSYPHRGAPPNSVVSGDGGDKGAGSGDSVNLEANKLDVPTAPATSPAASNASAESHDPGAAGPLAEDSLMPRRLLDTGEDIKRGNAESVSAGVGATGQPARNAAGDQPRRVGFVSPGRFRDESGRIATRDYVLVDVQGAQSGLGQEAKDAQTSGSNSTAVSPPSDLRGDSSFETSMPMEQRLILLQHGRMLSKESKDTFQHDSQNDDDVERTSRASTAELELHDDVGVTEGNEPSFSSSRSLEHLTETMQDSETTSASPLDPVATDSFMCRAQMFEASSSEPSAFSEEPAQNKCLETMSSVEAASLQALEPSSNPSLPILPEHGTEYLQQRDHLSCSNGSDVSSTVGNAVDDVGAAINVTAGLANGENEISTMRAPRERNKSVSFQSEHESSSSGAAASGDQEFEGQPHRESSAWSAAGIGSKEPLQTRMQRLAHKRNEIQGRMNQHGSGFLEEIVNLESQVEMLRTENQRLQQQNQELKQLEERSNADKLDVMCQLEEFRRGAAQGAIEAKQEILRLTALLAAQERTLNKLQAEEPAKFSPVKGEEEEEELQVELASQHESASPDDVTGMSTQLLVLQGECQVLKDEVNNKEGHIDLLRSQLDVAERKLRLSDMQNALLKSELEVHKLSVAKAAGTGTT